MTKYAAIISSLVLALISSSVKANTSQANVLLILTDNQAYNELSFKGHPVVKTPHIDKFSKEGIDFTNFHAPAYCSPSRAALITGRHPLRNVIHNTIGGVSILHKREKTLADFFNEAGYRGYVGIEYEGKKLGEVEGIKATRDLLIKIRSEFSS